jgi:ABC-type Fe3+/spermidine/putrescine transport system ATPase subunit
VTDADRPAAGDEVTLALRPESVRLAPAGTNLGEGGSGWATVSGRVRSDTYLGDQHEYRVDVPGLGELIARSQAFGPDGPGQAFRPGEDVAIGWHEGSALVLTS